MTWIISTTIDLLHEQIALELKVHGVVSQAVYLGDILLGSLSRFEHLKSIYTTAGPSSKMNKMIGDPHSQLGVPEAIFFPLEATNSALILSFYASIL
jgi:hypothetical protein